MEGVHFQFGEDHFVLSDDDSDELLRRIDERGAEPPCPRVAEQIIRTIGDAMDETECHYPGCSA